jgi:putative peptidoglycan lipid II flippase
VRSINVVILITLPATFLIISLAEPIVRIAFQRGAFDQVATNMTKSAVVFYIIGLSSMSMNFVIQKVYYAFQDTKIPMLNSLYSMIINVILSLLLAKTMGHAGLALGTSIAGIFMCISLMGGLKKKIVDLKYINFYICLLKSVTASIFMGVFAYKLYTLLMNILIPYNFLEVGILLITLIISALVYLVILKLLRVEEIEWLQKIVRRKLKLEV